MEKIPFDIKYIKEIVNNTYKVVTRDNKNVRVICWDRVGSQPIVGLIEDPCSFGLEYCTLYFLNGKTILKTDNNEDLFLIKNN